MLRLRTMRAIGAFDPQRSTDEMASPSRRWPLPKREPRRACERPATPRVRRQRLALRGCMPSAAQASTAAESIRTVPAPSCELGVRRGPARHLPTVRSNSSGRLPLVIDGKTSRPSRPGIAPFDLASCGPTWREAPSAEVSPSFLPRVAFESTLEFRQCLPVSKVRYGSRNQHHRVHESSR